LLAFSLQNQRGDPQFCNIKSIKKTNAIKTVLALTALSVSLYSCNNEDDTVENSPPEIKAQTFSASEAIDDAHIIGKVKANDPDGDQLVFSITENSNGLFEITSQGDLSLTDNATLDYETANSHTIKVAVTDGTDSTEESMTITVVDVDENQAPVIAANQEFAIDENSPAGVAMGTIMATDPDGDALKYSIASTIPASASNVFAIDADTGALTNTADNLDREAQNSYLLNINVSDGSLSSSIQIKVVINDIDEAPVFTNAPYTFEIAEDTAPSTQVGVVTATDPENADITFSLVPSEAGPNKFSVNPNGIITLHPNHSLDYETAAQHIVKVMVSDGGLTTTEDVTINVTDVDDSVLRTTTFLGKGGASGFMDGVGAAARFSRPKGIAILGDDMYIADTDNHIIRHVQISTGAVSIYAGKPGVTGFDDGSKTGATFDHPTDVAVDQSGVVYVADSYNHAIRKIDAGGVATLAGNGTAGLTDQTGDQAQFEFPSGVAVTANGKFVYVADTRNNAIRKITDTGVVTTMVGNGTVGDVDGGSSVSRLNAPTDITINKTTNLLFVTDSGNHKVKVLDAGGGLFTLASQGIVIRGPQGVAVDTTTDALYITTAVNGLHTVLKATLDDSGLFYDTQIFAGRSGVVGYVDGPADISLFRKPVGVVVDPADGSIYVGDSENHIIRKVAME
jgi:DNA-binding beta-propeller fold protein YncE